MYTEQGLPKVVKYIYYLRNGYSYELQIRPIHSQGPSEQKPIKNFAEKGARERIQRLSKVLNIPYYLRNG